MSVNKKVCQNFHLLLKIVTFVNFSGNFAQNHTLMCYFDIMQKVSKEHQMTSKPVLRIEKLPHNRKLPFYATEGAAGMDLAAAIDEPVTLKPLERKLIPTGIIIELPTGYEAQIRPRSGLSIKHGITLINCVGTIDEDYRGEVCVPLVNLSDAPYEIQPGERVAQMVICPVRQVEIEVVEKVGATERASGGFGSTGR